MLLVNFLISPHLRSPKSALCDIRISSIICLEILKSTQMPTIYLQVLGNNYCQRVLVVLGIAINHSGQNSFEKYILTNKTDPKLDSI